MAPTRTTGSDRQRRRRAGRLTFSTGSVGAFDSLLGLTVLAEVVVNELVERRRDDVVARLDALDATWTSTGVFDG